MAIFGNNSVGATDWSGNIVNGKCVAKFTLAEAGLVSKLTAYIQNWDVSCHIRAAIYYDSAGVPEALKGTGTDTTFAPAGYAWVDLPFPSNVSLSAGDYWLGVQGDANAGGFTIKDVASGGSSDYVADTFSDGLVDPWGGTHNAGVHLCSIYATYTTASFTGLTVTRLLQG